MPRPVLIAAVTACLLAPLPLRANPPAPAPGKEGTPADALVLRMGGRMRHPLPVVSIFYVAGGKAILTETDEGALRWWDAATGTAIRTFRFPGPRDMAPPDLDISSDGSRLAFVAEDGIRVLDLATGQIVRRLTDKDLRSKDRPLAVRLSGDGKLLATWEREADKEKRPRPVIAVRDLTTGKVMQRLRGDGEAGVSAVLFAPDGKTATLVEMSGENTRGRLVTYDLATGKAVKRVEPAEAISDADPVQLLNGQRLLAFSDDGQAVLLLDAGTGKVLRRFEGGRANLFGLSASADGKRFVSSDDTSAILWETETGKQLRRIELVKGNKDDQDPPVAALSPDGRSIAVGLGRSVRIWDAATGKERGGEPGHDGTVQSLAYSPDGGRLLSGSSDNTFRMWEAKSGKQLHTFAAPKVAAADKEQGKEMMPFAEYRAGGAFARDGKSVALLWPLRKIQLRDTASGKLTREVGGAEGQVLLALAPNGKYVAGAGADGVIRLWDTATGTAVRRFALPTTKVKDEARPSAVVRLAFSPDGRTLRAGGVQEQGLFGNVHECEWEVASGRPRAERKDALGLGLLEEGDLNPGREDLLLGLFLETITFSERYSADGKVAIVCGVTTMRLRDPASGKEIRTFGGRGVQAGTAALSPDGALLAAGRVNGNVSVWSVANGTLLADFRAHEARVSAVAFSPDGKHLATGSVDANILVWDVARVLKQSAARIDRPTAKELDALWKTLAAEDAEDAAGAVAALSRAPAEAVPFLRERLRPAAPVDVERIERLLAALNDKRFAERQKAAQELEKLGSVAAPALRKLLATEVPLEVRQRGEALMQKVDGPVTNAELLRALRAVEALDRAGTPEADAVLRALAGGAEGHPVTENAREALARRKLKAVGP